MQLVNLQRCVLRADLNWFRVLADLTCWGKLFQSSDDEATWNERRPYDVFGDVRANLTVKYINAGYRLEIMHLWSYYDPSLLSSVDSI